MKFGDRLRTRREEKKLTQDQLGKGLSTGGDDASKSVVLGWEKNRHFPRADQLAMICERLDCSADYLLFGRTTESVLRPEVLEVAQAINDLSPPRRRKFLASVKQLVEDAQDADRASLLKSDEIPHIGESSPPERRIG